MKSKNKTMMIMKVRTEKRRTKETPEEPPLLLCSKPLERNANDIVYAYIYRGVCVRERGGIRVL